MENTTNTESTSKKSGTAFGVDAGLQEKVLKQINDLGDSLERVGEKIEKNGWETVGQAIYKLGNTLEHLKQKSGIKKPEEFSGERKYTDVEYDQKTKKTSDKIGSDDSKAY
ncbi:MAG: hypothetical protein JST04_06850 [Bdellovibrionales bacterium]|nr:hypothetical protein [Bdellovibrionales bacterium]